MNNIEEYRQRTTLRNKQNYPVVKANTLIQQSRFYLNALEKKIILYLISKIKPYDDEFNIFEFEIGEFCDVCEIDSKSGKNYSNVKQTFKNLADKSIWVKQDNGSEVLYRWFDYVTMNKNSGKIIVKIHDLMKPHLLNLLEKYSYTQYTLNYVLAMKSQYSIRLYELLKSYQFKNKCEFDIDEFKLKIGAEKYARHADFMRFVFTPAVKELEDLSDIKVTYSLCKTGKKYTRISFTVYPKIII